MFAMENALAHDAPPPMTSLKQGFHLFTGRTLRQLGANDVQLQEAVDIMGKRSARAQGSTRAKIRVRDGRHVRSKRRGDARDARARRGARRTTRRGRAQRANWGD